MRLIVNEKKFNDGIDRRIAAKVRELVTDDIYTMQSASSKAYKGNEYLTYEKAVIAIDKKYSGTAKWGVLLTGNIIDVRAAFTVPSKLDIIKTKDEAFREVAFAEEFLKFNGLDKQVPIEFAKEAEIEAKLLTSLDFDKDHKWLMAQSEGDEKKLPTDGMTRVRFMPWTSYGYKVITATDDYMNYEKIIYTPIGGSQKKTIKSPNFTYRPFGGRINKPDNPAPKIWKCLTAIDNLDKALRDLREINNLFAGPILALEVPEKKYVADAQAQLDKMNLKIRKMIAHAGKLSYILPEMRGVDSLIKEIIALAKFISGTTGVPVHFLGLPDLMSNRSTAENLMELIWASTVKERDTWESAYNEMLKKAIDQFNENTKSTKLDPEAVEIKIQSVTKEQWERLEKVYLPLYDSGAISLDFLLLQIPNLNIEEEKKRREGERDEEMETIKKELDQEKVEKDMLKKNQFNVNNKIVEQEDKKK